MLVGLHIIVLYMLTIYLPWFLHDSRGSLQGDDLWHEEHPLDPGQVGMSLLWVLLKASSCVVCLVGVEGRDQARNALAIEEVGVEPPLLDEDCRYVVPA